MKKYQTQKGFALFISLVIMGIILTASVAIIDIAVKELSLSSGDRESQHAFYAADAGLECALYGDFVLGVFNDSGEILDCTGIKNVVINEDGSQTSTFQIELNNISGGVPEVCATVVVEKETSGKTYIESSGYNKCTEGYAKRVERSIQFDY